MDILFLFSCKFTVKLAFTAYVLSTTQGLFKKKISLHKEQNGVQNFGMSQQ